MSLDRVIDPLASRLATVLGSVEVGDVAPAAAADLPRVVLSLEHAQQALVGIGRLPRGTRTGALRRSTTVDLADPVLDLGGGNALQLLSADRRTLTLPHGPVVRADGTADLPFDDADVSADDGEPFTLVDAAPTGREVRVDPMQGTLTFGDPLPNTGSLEVSYHVGQWDTVTTRVQGLLTVQVTAATADAVSSTARDVARALDAPALGSSTVPVSWGPVVPAGIEESDARSQVMTFHLDAELEDPVLTTGGGVIAQVTVTGRLTDPARPAVEPELVEPFHVTRGVPT
jgi:hypothetical protein